MEAWQIAHVLSTVDSWFITGSVVTSQFNTRTYCTTRTRCQNLNRFKNVALLRYSGSNGSTENKAQWSDQKHLKRQCYKARSFLLQYADDITLLLQRESYLKEVLVEIDIFLNIRAETKQENIQEEWERRNIMDEKDENITRTF